jgi:glycosyltransferase involved in cell wall biosynthesis
MTKALDISFIIPTYRRPAFLAEALASILELTSLSIEVMVIDDSPDGEGAEVVNSFNDGRIRYTKREVPSKGRPAQLRNEAAAHALGAVLYFHDDDDMVITDALPGAFAEFQQSRSGVLICIPEPFGGPPDKVENEIAFFSRARDKLVRTPSSANLSAHLIFSDSLVTCSACMIKRGTFTAIGGFDESIALAEDVDFYSRAIAVDGYVFTHRPFARRRVGQPSLIADAKREVLDQSYSQIRQSFRKRRGTVAYFAYRAKHMLQRYV